MGKNKKDKPEIAPEAVPTMDFEAIKTDMGISFLSSILLLFLNTQRLVSYLQQSYTKIQAARFDPRMIEQMKVNTGTSELPLKNVAQVIAKTQVSYLITPFDPSV